jgi:tRNA dimethylallyltransferase
MTQIYERGHIPILTGGTGFYIQAVLKDIDFTENEDNNEYRRFLENLGQEKGAEHLHLMLQMDRLRYFAEICNYTPISWT